MKEIVVTKPRERSASPEIELTAEEKQAEFVCINLPGCYFFNLYVIMIHYMYI